jgi:D-glycero-D-manno-heptose 1,7-bisphosphate phosphatase
VKPAAFLDRDGTVNYDDGYTYRIEEFRWVEGAKEAIKQLNDAGYLVFLVTNQAGIARGYYAAADVDNLHEWMQRELADIGAHLDDIRFCPHHPQGAVPELSHVCDCRKPGTGMLTSLIDQWNPDLSKSFMLGDADKDAEAGTAVGVKGRKIPTGALRAEVEKILMRENSPAAG